MLVSTSIMAKVIQFGSKPQIIAQGFVLKYVKVHVDGKSKYQYHCQLFVSTGNEVGIRVDFY